MTIQIHLFPETAVVHFPTSYFSDLHVKTPEIVGLYGIRHDNLMKLIRGVIKDIPEEEQLLNFKELSEPYTVKNGAKRQRKIFLLSEWGFAYVSAKLRCPDANRHTWQMLMGFKDMRHQLAEREARYVRAFDIKHPALRPTVEGTEAGRSRAEIGGLLAKSPAAITYHRRRARELGLLKRRTA